MVLAPQAFPFRPAPDTIPLPPLPPGPLPTYTVLPSLVAPLWKKNIVKGYKSTPYSNEPEKHLTLWSCFEFGESLDGSEERKMREHDLDFQPLHHPTPSSGKDPWPEFVVSAEPADMSLVNVVSAPPMTTVSPPSKPNDQVPRNFLYQGFKRYMAEKGL